MNGWKTGIGLLAAAATLGTVAYAQSGRGQDDEEPGFTLVSSENGIEIRDYAPMIVAETQVSGNGSRARNAGFRILADYIFGNNVPDDKIAMTSPVTQQENTQGSERNGEKIAMTSAVAQQEADEGSLVTFVMPAKYTMETLPEPRNDRVTLREIPAKRVAAVRFGGRADNSDLEKQEAKLRAFLTTNDLTPTSPASYAFYDAPWVPAPMRRNEVMFDLE